MSIFEKTVHELLPPTISASIYPYAIFVSSSVLAFVFGYYLSQRLLGRGNHRRLSLPPGPKGLPILGNLLDVPTTFPGHNFEKMGKELGSDILYLNVAGTKIVVLNSHEACWDLLEKRSAIYSSRPPFPMLIDLWVSLQSSV
ncbi:hypothetical protein PM082_018908 [Marasmius tenuissimus]|nr:hypothetical protein PM082_018908 [Marasmius tenuissimus]